MQSAWIYMLMLGLVIILYAMLRPRENNQSVNGEMMSQMEQALDQFSFELEEENKKLLQLIAEMKNQSDIRYVKLEERVHHIDEKIEKASARINQLERTPVVEQVEHKLVAAVKEEVEVEVEASPFKQMRSRYEDLFKLHQSGKSMEYIAKKLGMNKGEVQLIITLASREDEVSV